MIFRLP